MFKSGLFSETDRLLNGFAGA